MKKIVAIFLSVILLFNWVGYRLLLGYMQRTARMRLETRLDNNDYDESQLICIKVPARHLSYYTNSSQFERIAGQIEINGVQYEYVQKRFFNDSLEFKCIADHSATSLQIAQNDFFRQVNDFQHFGNEKKPTRHSTPSFSFSNDFYLAGDQFRLADNGFPISKTVFHFFAVIPLVFLLTGEQPPDIHA